MCFREGVGILVKQSKTLSTKLKSSNKNIAYVFVYVLNIDDSSVGPFKIKKI